MVEYTSKIPLLLQQLRDAGYSWRELADELGVNHATIVRAAQTGRVRPKTARRIVALYMRHGEDIAAAKAAFASVQGVCNDAVAAF